MIVLVLPVLRAGRGYGADRDRVGFAHCGPVPDGVAGVREMGAVRRLAQARCTR
jgi:hypothetical protein